MKRLIDERVSNIVICTKKVCNENKFVSIYSNCADTEKFIYGKILYVNEEEVLIYMVSPNGDFDGLLVMPITRVFRLEYGGDYEAKMKLLMSQYELPVFDYSVDNLHIGSSILKIALETGQIVSIELLDSDIDDVVGIVESVDRNLCKIKQINDYGREDGYSIINLDDITQISYNSEDERRRKVLCKKLRG